MYMYSRSTLCMQYLLCGSNLTTNRPLQNTPVTTERTITPPSRLGALRWVGHRLRLEKRSRASKEWKRMVKFKSTFEAMKLPAWQETPHVPVRRLQHRQGLPGGYGARVALPRGGAGGEGGAGAMEGEETAGLVLPAAAKPPEAQWGGESGITLTILLPGDRKFPREEMMAVS